MPELLSSRQNGLYGDGDGAALSDRFIIFDTLHALASSEPAILASMVGQTVFVVAAHETSVIRFESSLRLINGLSECSPDPQ